VAGWVELMGSPMVLSKRAIQAVAFAVFGLVLVAVGGFEYEASATAAQNYNNDCPANELCPTAIPNEMFLLMEYVGVVLLVVAALLGALAAMSSPTEPRTAA
jgi:hypothetical protein